MSKKEYVLFPVGRLVGGSLYEPQTTDIDGKPLVYKSGDKTGQPRVNFYFGFAIPKAGEQSWTQTSWGALIYAAAQAAWPQGQFQAPAFAWKITDGDSTVLGKPGRNGATPKRPCEREGYPGCWIVNFSGSNQAPRIRTKDGKQDILQKDYVGLGDWIQVYASVKGNESPQQPGMYLTPDSLAFYRHGDPIILGVDPSTVGFGQAPLPPGFNYYDSPQGAGFNPAPPAAAAPVYTAPGQHYGAGGGAPAAPAPVYTPPPAAYTPPPVASAQPAPLGMPPVPPMAPAAVNMPPPHTQILTPPAPLPPAAPVRVMLPAAGGVPYEAFIAQNWTDAMLVQHGMMAP